MVFSSSVFLFLFLPVVIGGYFLMPGWRARNLWLLAASLLFYSWGELHYVLILLVSIACNAFFGARIAAADRRRGLLLAAAISVNLLLLGYYKYAGFITANLAALLALFDLPGPRPADVHLPLGISFFTFQAISYIVDVYRRQVPAQKSALEVGLYISMFPQLVAGPIVRYGDIADQLRERVVTLDGMAYGARRFIIGLVKKVLIANVLGQTADEIFAHQTTQLDPALAWLGIVCYTLQIYFDFSGYSDMAIGLGRMFGFRYPENFNHPYIARSVREFWRRWHMSLSRWFRDYLYIPLGGNRYGSLRTSCNLLIVFFLCGLWHGAAWNFVVWGLYHGMFLVVERSAFGRLLSRMPRLLQHVYLLLVVVVGWTLFRADSLGDAVEYLSVMAGMSGRSWDGYALLYLDLETLLALAAGLLLAAVPTLTTIEEPARTPAVNEPGAHAATLIRDAALLSALLLAAVYVSAQSYNPFIYFRF